MKFSNSQTFEIKEYPWDDTGYRPETTVTLSYDANGFVGYLKSYEKVENLRRVETENNNDIYIDSCMEMFIMFAPHENKNYINFEINPNGAMFCSKGEGRESLVKFSPELIDRALMGRTRIHSDYWEAWVTIPLWFIKEAIPEYEHKEGAVIKANFYKCGSNIRHLGMWNRIEWEKPDFHRPEFFKEIVL